MHLPETGGNAIISTTTDLVTVVIGVGVESAKEANIEMDHTQIGHEEIESWFDEIFYSQFQTLNFSTFFDGDK